MSAQDWWLFINGDDAGRFISPGSKQAERIAKSTAGKRPYALYPVCPKCDKPIPHYADWADGEPAVNADGFLCHPDCVNAE